MFFHLKYLFNNRENKDKELAHLPPLDDYLPGSKKVEKRCQLEKWYSENQNTPFSLRKALQEYVENDTLILLHALVAFRNLLKRITKGIKNMKLF